MKHRTKLFLTALVTTAVMSTAHAAPLYEIPTFGDFADAPSGSTERFVTDIVLVNIAAGVTGYSAVEIDENQTYQPANDTSLNSNPRFGNNINNSGGVIGGQKPGFIVLDDSTPDPGYVEFAISATDAGTVLNLTSLTFDAVRGTNGTAVRSYVVDASVDGGVFFELDSQEIAANLASATPSSFSIDLSGAAYQGVDSFTIRFSDPDDTIEISNLAINGEVVPEPGSLALLALGGLCVLRRRRK